MKNTIYPDCRVNMLLTAGREARRARGWRVGGGRERVHTRHGGRRAEALRPDGAQKQWHQPARLHSLSLTSVGGIDASMFSCASACSGRDVGLEGERRRRRQAVEGLGQAGVDGWHPPPCPPQLNCLAERRRRACRREEEAAGRGHPTCGAPVLPVGGGAPHATAAHTHAAAAGMAARAPAA